MEDENILFKCGNGNNNINLTGRDFARIYNHIGDNKSKRIWKNRLLFSLTEDYAYIRDILEMFPVGKSFSKELQDNKKQYFIYGAGIRGRRLIRLYPEVKWEGFIDKIKSGSIIDGLNVYSLDSINPEKDVSVVISNMHEVDEIVDDLKKHDFEDDSIIAISDYDERAGQDRYFESCYIGKGKNINTFVDAGAFDGIDTERFLSWAKGTNLKAYVFEPDKDNYEFCKRKFSESANVIIYNCGLLDKSSTLNFSGKGQGSSISSMSVKDDTGITKVDVVALDDVIGDCKIDYIKMDIEGSELQALKGAQGILEKYHPMLALSIYHKREDIWEIPEYLLSIDNNYRFYLSHYRVGGVTDTVLYAV